MRLFTNYFIWAILNCLAISVFAQNADQLNEQSKKHLQSGEIDKAIPLIKQAAELGNAEAQYNLGYCFQSGTGIGKDPVKAAEWYLKSANQGYNDGLYQMMMAYGNGDGVEQNPEKAFSFALKCAENNDPTCMWNVVNCYHQGLGTTKDLNKILNWAIRLAKLENPENLTQSGYITSTRLQLAKMYRDGKELKLDYFLSYQWFLIYNEFKVDFSIMEQESVIKEIKELELKLKTKQKEEARSKAETLFGRPLKNLASLYRTDI